MKRTKPLRRSTTPIKRRSNKRASELREYARKSAAYLALHPYCQITIFMWGLSEAEVIIRNGIAIVRNEEDTGSQRIWVPPATQIHHRNKRTGKRLTDDRWFMSAAHGPHEWVERNKSKARELSLLLPINADADGRWAGSGDESALETIHLLAWRQGTVRKRPPEDFL